MNPARKFVVLTPLLAATILPATAVAANILMDLAKIRGANYRAAGAKDTTDHWLHYKPAETGRDLDYARRLNLNQIRIFVSYEAWTADKPAFRENLVHLLRASINAGWELSPWWATRSE